MAIFKITNITDSLGKRDVNFNKTLEISYVDDMERKTQNLKPKETLYFNSLNVPISVHRLRVKSLITVDEITGKEMKAINDAEKRKKNPTTTTTTTTEKKPKKSTTYKKKSTTTEKESSEKESSEKES